MIGQQQLFLTKADESFEGAESEYGNHRYNNVANRAYYCCFLGAIYALIQAGIASVEREQWGHEFVQTQFVLQLVNRRKVYPSELRDTLSRNLIVRQRADYEAREVSEVEARRALDRARRFLEAVDTQRG